MDAIAERLARFDHEAIARTKHHVDRPTLPTDEELAAALPDFFAAFGRPGPQARQASSPSLGSTPTATSSATTAGVIEASPDTTS